MQHFTIRDLRQGSQNQAQRRKKEETKINNRNEIMLQI